MKTKNLIIFFAITIFLIAGGVWLGIVLTQKNSEPTQIVLFEVESAKQQNPTAVLFVNQKNKVIDTQFAGEQSKRIFEKVDCIGRDTSEALAEFASKCADFFDENQSQQAYVLRLEFYCTDAEQMLCSKKQSEQKIANKMKDFQTLFDIKSSVFAEISNARAKFSKISGVLGIDNEQFDTLSHQQIVKSIFEQASQSDT